MMEEIEAAGIFLRMGWFCYLNLYWVFFPNIHIKEHLNTLSHSASFFTFNQLRRTLLSENAILNKNQEMNLPQRTVVQLIVFPLPTFAVNLFVFFLLSSDFVLFLYISQFLHVANCVLPYYIDRVNLILLLKSN